jgi:DNA-binding NarL/FixJ family response regulator
MTETYHEAGNIDEAAIRVVLADDHPGVRASIRGLLEKAEGIQVVGEAGTGFEALHQVRIHQPDVLLLDIEMPDLNGVEAVGPGAPELI